MCHRLNVFPSSAPPLCRRFVPSTPIAKRVADVPSLLAVLGRAQCVRADVSALDEQCRSERIDVEWRFTSALSLRLQWRLERTIASAFAINSARALLTANDTERIIDVDERGRNAVDDTGDVDAALKMIRREAGVDERVSNRRFVWFVSALVSFPSDEAFDVVSAALTRDD